MLNNMSHGKTLLGAVVSIALSASSMSVAVADDQIPSSRLAQPDQIQPMQLVSFGGEGMLQASHSQLEVSTIVTATASTLAADSADEASVEELFTTYISLDKHNYMHVNVDEVSKSQYAHNITDLQNFALFIMSLITKILAIVFAMAGHS